jgi:hypothetical protein
MDTVLKNDKELGFSIGYRCAFMMLYDELIGEVKEA